MKKPLPTQYIHIGGPEDGLISNKIYPDYSDETIWVLKNTTMFSQKERIVAHSSITRIETIVNKILTAYPTHREKDRK